MLLGNVAAPGCSSGPPVVGLLLLLEPPGPGQQIGAETVLVQAKPKKWESLRGVPGEAASAGEPAVSSRKPEARGDPWRPGLFSVGLRTLGNRNSEALRSLSSGGHGYTGRR